MIFDEGPQINTIQHAFELIKEKDVKGLKYCVEKGFFDINESNEFGETLLGRAVWLQNVEIVNFLCMQEKIDVNKKTCFYLGEESLETEYYTSPLELTAFILPVLKYGQKPFLDYNMKQISGILIQKGAKAPLKKYRNDERFKCCMYDLLQVIKSTTNKKTTKTIHEI